MLVKAITCVVTDLVVALEGLEVVDAVQRSGVPDPLQSLPVGDQPHVVHGDQGVEESDEALLVVRLGEPGGVVEQSERSTVGGVVALEVLDQHLIHTVGGRWVRARVTHGAATTIQIRPHDHRYLPHTFSGKFERDKEH